MANMYTAAPIPPKAELERLYHDMLMSQEEVGAVFGVSQRVVFGWFKKLGIKSRVAYPRNGRGENSNSWRGDRATYAAMHYRVQARFGRPQLCEGCLTRDPAARFEWANLTGAYGDVNDYIRLCKMCHIHFDNIPERSAATQRQNRRSALADDSPIPLPVLRSGRVLN
jgi:hypothetical protein